MLPVAPIACVLLLALAGPASATPEEGAAFQKRRAAVLEKPGAYGGVVRQGLEDMGRFEFLPVSGSGDEPLGAFLARVRAAGPGEGPLYVFVPSWSFGALDATEPRTQTEKLSNGRIKTTLSAEVRCPFTYVVAIYDARTGELVKRLSNTDDLTRRFEAVYDQLTSDKDVGYKQGLLLGRVQGELRRPPHEAFADLAQRDLGGIQGWFKGELRHMAEFQLRARVTGWDSRRDLVFIDMGRNFKLGLNGGFKLVRDGRELGYMRVVHTETATSEVKPVFLDAVLRAGDQLVEYPKSNGHVSLKGGLAWLGGPAAVGGFGLEGDCAPLWGGTDFFATLDLSGLKAAEVMGGQIEVGLVKKLYWRRWGLSLGLKPGVAVLNGLNSTKTAAPFGATAVAGVNCYLTPDFVANVDLGFAAYTPVLQQNGTGAGKSIQPFGPVAKVGMSLVF